MQRRYRGTLRYIYAHWPAYLALYGGIVLALLVIGISAQQGWIGYIPLMLALLIILAYFFVASLWLAHQLYDSDGLRPHDVLFDLGHIEATDTFLYVDLGLRHQAMHLGRRLTTGQIIVVDIYNPQWMANPALVRWRKRMPHPPYDPRLVWKNGRLDLLPLPDKTVSIVFLNQVLGEFWQEGDRLELLKEVYRVLPANGRILLAEPTTTQTNWLIWGPLALNLYPIEYWRNLLTEAGFQVGKIQELKGVLHCFRAEKPIPTEARQLTLQLEDFL